MVAVFAAFPVQVQQALEFIIVNRQTGNFKPLLSARVIVFEIDIKRCLVQPPLDAKYLFACYFGPGMKGRANGFDAFGA